MGGFWFLLGIVIWSICSIFASSSSNAAGEGGGDEKSVCGGNNNNHPRGEPAPLLEDTIRDVEEELHSIDDLLNKLKLRKHELHKFLGRENPSTVEKRLDFNSSFVPIFAANHDGNNNNHLLVDYITYDPRNAPQMLFPIVYSKNEKKITILAPSSNANWGGLLGSSKNLTKELVFLRSYGYFDANYRFLLTVDVAGTVAFHLVKFVKQAQQALHSVEVYANEVILSFTHNAAADDSAGNSNKFTENRLSVQEASPGRYKIAIISPLNASKIHIFDSLALQNKLLDKQQQQQQQRYETDTVFDSAFPVYSVTSVLVSIHSQTSFFALVGKASIVFVSSFTGKLLSNSAPACRVPFDTQIKTVSMDGTGRFMHAITETNELLLFDRKAGKRISNRVSSSRRSRGGLLALPRLMGGLVATALINAESGGMMDTACEVIDRFGGCNATALEANAKVLGLENVVFLAYNHAAAEKDEYAVVFSLLNVSDYTVHTEVYYNGKSHPNNNKQRPRIALIKKENDLNIVLIREDGFVIYKSLLEYKLKRSGSGKEFFFNSKSGGGGGVAETSSLVLNLLKFPIIAFAVYFSVFYSKKAKWFGKNKKTGPPNKLDGMSNIDEETFSHLLRQGRVSYVDNNILGGAGTVEIGSLPPMGTLQSLREENEEEIVEEAILKTKQKQGEHQEFSRFERFDEKKEAAFYASIEQDEEDFALKKKNDQIVKEYQRLTKPEKNKNDDFTFRDGDDDDDEDD